MLTRRQLFMSAMALETATLRHAEALSGLAEARQRYAKNRARLEAFEAAAAEAEADRDKARERLIAEALRVAKRKDGVT